MQQIVDKDKKLYFILKAYRKFDAGYKNYAHYMETRL